MKLFRLAATLATTIGLELVGVCFAAAASAKFAPEPPAYTSTQLVTPPAPTSSGGTSVWWFVLVAAAAVAATVAVMIAVRAFRARRMVATAG